MATFTFGGATTAFSSVNGNSTLSFNDGGVDFTLSVQSGDGANFGSIGSGSIILSRVSGGTISQESFILDATGAGQTRFDGAIQINASMIVGTWTVNGVALANGVNNLTGPLNSLVFSGSTDAQLTITSLVADVNCFLAGTRIATPEGHRAVEDLQPGDTVLTKTGASTVKWLGRQPIDTCVNHPDKVNPICIAAGALGQGLPERDLFLSPDHAIELDGYLINAGALVNGTTIYQVADMPLDGFTYYHVETDAHELLFAEGVAAETFVGLSETDAFVNWEEREDRMVPMMDLPRISTARLVPDTLMTKLSDRALLLMGRKAA